MPRGLLIASCVLVFAASLAAGSSAAPAGWDTYYVVHKPMSLALPPSWTTLDLQPGESFNAGNDALAFVQVFPFTGEKSQARFFAGLQVNARNTYLAQDPHAVIRVRTVTLPAGRALEIIAQLTRTVGGQTFRLWIQNYNLFYAGVGYDVEYQGPPAADGIDIPVFDQSAQTIRFGGGPAGAPAQVSKTA